MADPNPPVAPDWKFVAWFETRAGRCDIYVSREAELCGLCHELRGRPWILVYPRLAAEYVVCRICLPPAFRPDGRRGSLPERLYTAATGLACWESLGTLTWTSVGEFYGARPS